MEIVLRFGADRRKSKIIEELNKQIKENQEEIRQLKTDLIFEQVENKKLKRKVNNFEKRAKNVGKTNK